MIESLKQSAVGYFRPLHAAISFVSPESDLQPVRLMRHDYLLCISQGSLGAHTVRSARGIRVADNQPLDRMQRVARQLKRSWPLNSCKFIPEFYFLRLGRATKAGDDQDSVHLPLSRRTATWHGCVHRISKPTRGPRYVAALPESLLKYG
jgi:hypothetical protein